MSKSYISSETLNCWFDNYDLASEGDRWEITDMIDELKNALAASQFLMLDAEKEDLECVKTINSGVVWALRGMIQLKKEVKEMIENGEILIQKRNAKKGEDDED